MDDVAAVTALIGACERELHGSVDISEADISGDFRRPSFDLDADTVVVTDGGAIVAFATEFHDRASVDVHPEARGRGLGAALLDWTEAHALARGAEQVGQTVSERDTAARALLTSRGYTVRWDAWVFEIALDREVDPPRLPDGLRLRTVRRGSDDRALYDLIETAFSEWPDRDPGWAFEDWRAAYLDRDDVDPDLVFVIEAAGGELVGTALCVEAGTEGWVDQLAVARSHRGRGLGAALLRAAFREFRRRGLRTSGLSTESRSGARGLYEHVGMRITRNYARFTKPLR